MCDVEVIDSSSCRQNAEIRANQVRRASLTVAASTDYATGHLGVPLKNVVSGVPSRDFYFPGSLLNVTLDSKHPLTLGLPSGIAIWSEGSIARYPGLGVLASGWLLGERYLAGHSALVDVPMGGGRMVLFGMPPTAPRAIRR